MECSPRARAESRVDDAILWMKNLRERVFYGG
jgi:hypothetical protein